MVLGLGLVGWRILGHGLSTWRSGFRVEAKKNSRERERYTEESKVEGKREEFQLRIKKEKGKRKKLQVRKKILKRLCERVELLYQYALFYYFHFPSILFFLYISSFYTWNENIII